MIEIKDLLGRWSDILFSEEAKKESIRNIISGIIGVNIKIEDVKIKDNIIYLNIKPIYKNEIFLKKDKIVSSLEKIFSKKNPPEIR